MKRCPECGRDYYDDTLRFCLDDGSALLDGPATANALNTAVMPAERFVEDRSGEMPTMALGTSAVASPAEDLYFQGKFYSDRGNATDFQEAIQLFEKAVQLDPNHAPSYVELARAYGTKYFFFDPDNKGLLAKSYALLRRAFAIEPHFAQAHEVKGYLLWSPANGFPHEQAIAEFQAALALDPELVDAHNWLAAIFFHIGLLEEADAEIETTLRLDPSKNIARLHKSVVHSYAGRYKEAVQGFRSLPQDLSSGLAGSMTAWCLLNLGRVDEASVLIGRLLGDQHAITGGQLASLNAMILVMRGDSSAAESAIAEALEKGSGSGHFHHTTHFIADAYALMGRPAESVRYLHLTADDGFPCYPLFNNDPNLEAIRSEAGFKEFMADQRSIWEGRRSKYGIPKRDVDRDDPAL